MAGIIANFGNDQTALSDLSDGLAARGSDASVWRHGKLGLTVRAALPMVHTSQGLTAVVDGVTEISRLLAEYAERGPEALARPGETYAIAVADPAREKLLLARSGDGPTLYYAEVGGNVFAAAEPGALFAAGARPEPDPESVRRFVNTGVCDDGVTTLYAGVRRVRPGEVVEMTASGVRSRAGAVGSARQAPSLPLAVQEAVRHGRVGVRLTGEPDDTALLAALLAHPGACRPIPAYQWRWRGTRAATGAEGAAARGDQPGARGETATEFAERMERASVRPEVITSSAADFLADLPQFLADLGEPVPDLTGYLLWASARASTGDSDVLLDPLSEPDDCLLRVADRLAARFGVTVRFPLTGHVGQLIPPAQLAQASRSDSPPDPATRRQGAAAQLHGLLLGIKDQVYAAFLTEAFAARTWVNSSTALARFDQFTAGRGRHHAAWFWRLYLVERWLGQLQRGSGEPAGHAPPEQLAVSGGDSLDRVLSPEAKSAPREAFAAQPGKNVEIAIDGRRWLRFPVRTSRFAPGDPVGRKVAGHVAELVAKARDDPRYRQVFGKPWYVVVAEKAVAVSQRRSYPLWDIRPGRAARGLARLMSRTPYRAGDRSAWTMQLAIREAGVMRLTAAVLASLAGRLCGRDDWFSRVAGRRAAAIWGPTEHSVPPVSLSATLGAADPDGVAEELVEALRFVLPPDAARNLDGCVVMAASDSRRRVGGLRANRPASFFEQALADNPLGQGMEQTPVAVMVSASAVRRAKRSGARRKRARQPASSR